MTDIAGVLGSMGSLVVVALLGLALFFVMLGASALAYLAARPDEAVGTVRMPSV
ncbi:hypothetical protein H7U34_10785 [Collinsella tanakaei]|nr:hypothetical protein [Collinsella tanakaei]